MKILLVLAEEPLRSARFFRNASIISRNTYICNSSCSIPATEFEISLSLSISIEEEEEEEEEAAMGDEIPLDEKSRRMRDLLSSFYKAASNSPKSPSLDTINSSSFDPDVYMNLLIQQSNLEGLLQRHVEMAVEIKNLDTDLQMLVYENYNKFISATETIKRMKNNIVGMEANMEQLLDKIMSVQSKSDGVNTSLFERREHIEKLHQTRNLLRQVQFIYDLPTRLGKCIKSEAYADAVRFFIGATPIFEAYGESSFRDCKKASEEAMGIVVKNLQAKLYSDSETVLAKAEAVVLLKQLDYPVDSLKIKLLEKLKCLLPELQIEFREAEATVSIFDEASKTGSHTDSLSSLPSEGSRDQVSISDFSERVRAFRIIFPDSEMQLMELTQDLFSKHFETVLQLIKKRINSANLLAMLRVVWTDLAMIDEVLPEAALLTYTLEAARGVIKQYISSSFSHLLLDVSESLKRVQNKRKEGSAEDSTLQIALESGKKAVIQGSMDLLLDFRQLLDDSQQLLAKLRDLMIDWVQEGFQDFFRALHNHFLVFSGRNTSIKLDPALMEGQGDKVLAGLVLVLAQLSIFIEQSAIPRITEEIAASFSGGGVRRYEYGPAFVPAKICRMFRSASEKFLHLYITMKTQKGSILLKKRFTTPNWVKHKEPREVHMFVDIFLQELEGVGTEIRQILPHGLVRKHIRSDSAGSTNSSRSNPMREDKTRKKNTNRTQSQLLESHLAKLFKQKMEIFTKVEHTQESVVSTIVKLCLKSLQEFVRLQTFNRSGFQQILLDVQFLRNPLKDIVEEEAAIGFLMDEVIVGAAERCLDPIPLESAILDKLIQAKLAKIRDLRYGS